MNIKWVSTTSKFFSDPTAWDSGTVPTASDVAVWDSSSSGDCTLDASIIVDGMKFSGYVGAFKSNNYAITTGSQGWLIPSAMTGTIDLGASTVTNSGNVNWLGVTDAQFLVTLATWIQRGGTLDVPTTWTDTSSRSRSFFSLTFDEGSYAKLIGTLTYSSKDIYVNGAIDIATLLQYYSVAATENGIHIADTGSITGTDFRLYYGKLFGNVSNIKTTGIILRDGFRSAGGDFKSPVTLVAYAAANASFTSAVKFEKSLTLSRQATGAFKVTMNATVEGDVISSGTGTGSYTIVGTVTASGLADQTIDVSAVTSPVGVPVTINKPAGTLTNAIGSRLKQAGNIHLPMLINFGTIQGSSGNQVVIAEHIQKPGSVFEVPELCDWQPERFVRDADTIYIAQAFLSGIDECQLDLIGNQSPQCHVELDRPSVQTQPVELIADSAVCLLGRQKGILKLAGPGTFSMCGDLETGAIDRSELTGTFLPTTGTFTERPVYKKFAYTASRHVSFLNNKNTGGMIQDVRNY